MQEQAWSFILQQGFGIAIMCIFCYVVYKYFTKEKKEDRIWFAQREEKLFLTIKEKDAIILDLHEKQYEMSKLVNETISIMISKLHSIEASTLRMENRALQPKKSDEK